MCHVTYIYAEKIRCPVLRQQVSSTELWKWVERHLGTVPPNTVLGTKLQFFPCNGSEKGCCSEKPRDKILKDACSGMPMKPIYDTEESPNKTRLPTYKRLPVHVSPTCNICDTLLQHADTLDDQFLEATQKLYEPYKGPSAARPARITYSRALCEVLRSVAFDIKVHGNAIDETARIDVALERFKKSAQRVYVEYLANAKWTTETAGRIMFLKASSADFVKRRDAAIKDDNMGEADRLEEECEKVNKEFRSLNFEALKREDECASPPVLKDHYFADYNQ